MVRENVSKAINDGYYLHRVQKTLLFRKRVQEAISITAGRCRKRHDIVSSVVKHQANQPHKKRPKKRLTKEEKTPVIDMAATGRNIHDLRVAAGMTIRDVQDACGVSATAVTKWQRGGAVERR